VTTKTTIPGATDPRYVRINLGAVSAREVRKPGEPEKEYLVKVQFIEYAV